MKKLSALYCLTAMLSTLAIAGCTTNTATYAGSSVPVTGQKDVPFTFSGSAALQLGGAPVPLIGFDISWVDATTHMYYLGAAQYAGIVTLDLNTLTNPAGPTVSMLGVPDGTFAGNISDPFNLDSNHNFEGGPNGVLVVNGTELWAADGSPYTYVNDDAGNTISYSNDNCNSSVKVINLGTKAVTAVYTNGCFEADELAYDSTDNLVLVGNPEEDPTLVTNPNATNGKNTPTAPFISLISTTTKKLVAQIPFDGTNGSPNALAGIEQPAYSSKTGYFYVAVPADGPNDLDPFGNPINGVIAVVDPKALKVIKKISLTNCGPAGMALGPDGQEAFLGCNSSAGPQVVSLVDGSMLASFPQMVPAPNDQYLTSGLYFYYGPGCDEVWYNPTLNEYFAACQFSFNNSGFGVADAGTGLDKSSIKFLQYVVDNPYGGWNPLMFGPSAGAAHSIASDPVSGAVIVPLPLGAPWCPSPASAGCLGIWAPQGSEVAKPY